VVDVARTHDLRAHMDGARLMNAVVASDVPAREWAGGFDTAWIDFTKGLGAPVGAVLAGSRELIDEAWRYKQMIGGALRQSGIVAAACLYALDHHVERLAEDHENARVLADGIAELPGFDVRTSETNIVIADVPDATALVGALWERGIEVTPMSATRIRCVTHLDVDRPGVERAIAAFREVAG
jgi:threonine aldolase